MTTMSEHLNARAVVQLGKKKLEHFKKLIEGSKIAISISTNEEPCTAGENLRRCAASIEENAVIVSDPNPSLLDAMEVLIRHNMSTYTNAATIGRKRATLESDGMRFIAVCSEADLSGDDGVLYARLSALLQARLVSLTQRQAVAMVESTQGNGREAWRLLSQNYDPMTDARFVQLFMQVVGCHFAKNADVLTGLVQWVAMMLALQKDHQGVLSPKLSRAMFLNVLPVVAQ